MAAESRSGAKSKAPPSDEIDGPSARCADRVTVVKSGPEVPTVSEGGFTIPGAIG
jgi:hypothetical protein